jgi:hypothetical protein
MRWVARPEYAQFVIMKGQEFFSGLGVAKLDGVQNERDVTQYDGRVPNHGAQIKLKYAGQKR